MICVIVLSDLYNCTLVICMLSIEQYPIQRGSVM